MYYDVCTLDARKGEGWRSENGKKEEGKAHKNRSSRPVSYYGDDA